MQFSVLTAISAVLLFWYGINGLAFPNAAFRKGSHLCLPADQKVEVGIFPVGKIGPEYEGQEKSVRIGQMSNEVKAR